MKTLLIEIGCEEIPAGYIVPALTALKQNMSKALTKARIAHGDARILGTPRHLALVIENVADVQEAQTTTLTGPPEKVAYDGDGNPTIAAQKFAEKAGVSIDEVQLTDTGKGRYLTATVEESCESAASIIEAMMEKQILAMPFPKSMRWGSLSISFARPITSLLGLLGDQVLDFTIGDIKSGNEIFGHPFMNPGRYVVPTADDYVAVPEKVGIMPEIEKRKEILSQAVHALAKENNAVVLDDPGLLDIVTNLVEWPYPVVGSFDEEFLEVPDEVLITAMREHQKYFALVDENQNLKPLFVAVNNTQARDMDVVKRGHEKVLRARLSDAKFFYETDLESSLDDFAEKLKKVTFHEKLGSVHDKVQRISQLVKYLAPVSGYDNAADLETKLLRAAKICKADLVSGVVIEFTKLQGVIGRAYATKAGEDAQVAAAIEQHYRPVQSGGRLPENPVAALLAISDKLDTICGCFSVGLIPTGGADPYALRRQGIGILQIMVEQNLTLSLSGLIEKGLAGFLDDDAKIKEVAVQVLNFLKNRMLNILTDQGASKEAVNSALGASFDNVPDLTARVKALDTLRKEPDFEPLSVTFKRVENILKKAENPADLAVDAALFENACEGALADAVDGVSALSREKIQAKDYDGALKEIATLRPAVDQFFEDVMVFAEDEKIKNNRIGLLASVSRLFKNIADFSKL